MALNFNGVEPTVIKYNSTDLNVFKYSVTENGLSGEATRASVSSYSKAALDGYVGLVNDTWGGITNASSLTKDKYYYIRVLVTDTNRYGKFCIRFKSYNGQTITTDNIGWGYDGEIIATIPVWGKPFPLTIQAGANSTVTVNRTSSPNQHANTGAVTSGGIVYYGDVLTITATPASGYKLVSFTINGTEYASGQTSAVSQTITVTSAVSIVINTEAAISWKTVWTGSRGVNAIRVITGSFSDGSGMYQGSSTIQQEIVSNAYPTRITYTLAQESPQTTDITQSGEYLTIGNNSSVRASINSSSNNIDFITVIKGNKPNSKVLYTGKAVTLTKVEQYY